MKNGVISLYLYIVFETICYALCIKDKEEDERTKKDANILLASFYYEAISPVFVSS